MEGSNDRPVPDWERRFRTPEIGFPDWSPHAPDRLVYPSNQSGIWQAHVLDHASGARRRVTDHPVGVTEGTPTLHGSGVLWFQDETGDESGQWFVEPFDGGDRRPFLEGVPRGWNENLAQAPGIVAAGISGDDGFGIFVSRGGHPAKEIARSMESLRIGGGYRGGFNRGGLSADGSLLCLEHSEHGDLIHAALRVVDPRTGATVGEQLDEGKALQAACWSPIPGDRRLAIVHEREGEERPGIWDLSTGERTDLRLDLTGVVEVHDWWPDGSALLLIVLREGRDRLYRCEATDGSLTPIDSPPGVSWRARVRPDGRVWLLHSRSDHPPIVLDDGGGEVLRAEGPEPPPAREFVSWHFDNPHGRRVHGFYVTPEGTGPWPVVMHVHGGPDWLDTDDWKPGVQSYVDHGFAVGMVNYRGSMGYGPAWRDAVIGDIGRPELEDVNAGMADLVRRGIADPTRAVVGGWSWGGYVTLMELGKHPDLWAAGIAGIPVGDYAASYEDLSPLLKAYDRALLGGTPDEVPGLMRDRNPINFVDRVRAPVLFLAGENDSRCPIRQVMLYVDRLRERDHPHDLYLFATGHGSLDTEEEIRQYRVIHEFLAKHIPAN